MSYGLNPLRGAIVGSIGFRVCGLGLRLQAPHSLKGGYTGQ